MHADFQAQAVLGFWFGEGAEYGKRHRRWFEKNATFDAEFWNAAALPISAGSLYIWKPIAESASCW